MPVITKRRFRRLLGRLDTPAFVGFVASLWDARGYDTRVEGDRVVVSDDGGQTVITVSHDGSLSGRLRGAMADPAPENGDVVVTSGAVERVDATEGTEVLGPGDLYGMALYGIDRERCTSLFETHLGRPPTVQPGDRRRRRAGNRVRTVGIVAIVLFAAAVAAVVGPFGTAAPSGNVESIAGSQTTVFGGNGSQGSGVSAGTTATTTTTTATTTTAAGIGSSAPSDVELAFAHADALENRSFRIEANATQRHNETVRASSHLSGVFGPDRTRYALTRVRDSERRSRIQSDLWAENGQVEERIVVSENETEHRTLRDENGRPLHPSEAVPFDPVYVFDLPGLLTTVESVEMTRLRTRPSAARRDHRWLAPEAGEVPPTLGTLPGFGLSGWTTVFEVRANLSDAEMSRLERLAGIENATMRAVVDSTGQFYSYSVSYNYSLAGESLERVRSVEFDQVGTATVDRPTWANRTTNGTDTTPTDSG